MTPLACARRPLQELLLLLPLRGPWVMLCWGWGPCGRGCWVSLGAVVLVKGRGSKELDILCFFLTILAFHLEGQVQA